MKILIKLLSSASCLFLPFLVIAQNSVQPYHLVSTISVGDSLKWDYLTVDTVNNHLFISHQSKTIVIDLTTEKLVGEIDPTPGVHGIAIDNELGKGFITDGKTSTVTVFD